MENFLDSVSMQKKSASIAAGKQKVFINFCNQQNVTKTQDHAYRKSCESVSGRRQ
jgi:hypothetical protein